MEEGLFQLLFILLIFVAAIFDSIARGRKKRQRMEELEREEDGEFESMEESPPAEPEPRAEDRATADQMVPEDFWAILTGQQPPPRREAPPPEEEPSPAAREERAPAQREPSPPERPHIPEPVPGDRYGRSDEADLTEPAGITYGIGDPWAAAPDISQGEIGVERSARRRPRSKRRFPGPDATRGRSASRYARLLEAGDRESLREAVVLREILDVPMARRGSFGGWEEER